MKISEIGKKCIGGLAILLALMAGIPTEAQHRPDSVRGVWITNVGSDVFQSRKNIKAAVDLCKKSGINTLFVVVWNSGRTLYPSQVMKKNFGISIMEGLEKRDPLQAFITEGHKQGLKVYAWFEYGFASSSKGKQGGIIIKKHPDWAALNREGEIASRPYTEWMNPFNPEVQDFVLSLIKEVVTHYDIDGIQGDERLPGVPIQSGYDPYTVQQYKATHHGAVPPDDYKDSAWIQWRADIISQLMKRIYTAVKKIKPDVMVSIAPGTFPWSLNSLLQDWPRWVKEGWVDFVCPQLYFTGTEYEHYLEDVIFKQIPAYKYRVFPGVLLKVGKQQPTPEELQHIIKLNRQYGINGEVFFYFEGLKSFPAYFSQYSKS